MNELRSRGFVLALITGSFDLYSKSVAAKLQIAHHYANTSLYFGSDDQIQSYDYTLDQSARKLLQLGEFCSSQNLDPSGCFVVGNGDGDLGLFRATHQGILLLQDGQKPELRRAAWKAITGLEQVPDTIEP